jgi:putative membrane protein
MTNPQTKTANELAEDRTDFAVKRTLMAADRTLMAWLRTALSMISFGFTIYKILQGFQGAEGYALANRIDPRVVGEFLVGLGTLSMVMGTVEYWFTLEALCATAHARIWMRPSFLMALIISLAGLGVFVSIIANLL